ncbi:uncharacterized protein LOC117122263 [Anneissia japonica]|uniref:uncharacterized protein LOC117122263 n=1 Tax=Anneissia japonica TaxID=1529436 RepID=UPI0014256493|nr:uncharacterized protein LOC117122263 [Anneissia japonica]
MYIANYLCARVFTITVHRAPSVGEMARHRPTRCLGLLGPPAPALVLRSRQGDADGRRSMTITPYKKRKRMLLGGIPRDQFDNAEKSRDFAMELLPDERQLLLSELHKLQSKKQNEEGAHLYSWVKSANAVVVPKDTSAVTSIGFEPPNLSSKVQCLKAGHSLRLPVFG